jgi:tRNA threonylcarbamoyladenosine biosynthesis protein TsaE
MRLPRELRLLAMTFTMEKTRITTSFEETQRLGIDFAKELTGGAVIALHGNLGSGKTTFVQGFAKGLGIEKNIISPTFIIMRTYIAGDKNFYHVDLYRIESDKDVEGLGLLELIRDPQNIVVIEWPDKIEHLLPENRVDIYFEYLGDDKRKITIK